MSARHLVPSAVALSILVAVMASAIVDRAGGQALRGEYKVGVLEPLTGPLALEGKRHLEQHYMLEAAARSLGVGHRRMLSGAGHDAQYMAALCPTGMVFVPSRAGRSHCEEEFTSVDDIEHGANVLFLACATLAGRAG